VDNQSLEEISLKLMHNIQQEKTELENQYAEVSILAKKGQCNVG
jgi:hypothetical protein